MMQFLRGLRQEDCKFKPYLSYTVSSQPAQGISETPSQNKKGRSLVHTSEAQGLLSKQERPQALSPALQKREERRKMAVDIIKTKVQTVCPYKFLFAMWSWNKSVQSSLHNWVIKHTPKQPLYIQNSVPSYHMFTAVQLIQSRLLTDQAIST